MTTDIQHDSASDTPGDENSHGGKQRPSYDDVNMPVVILVGFISMVLTFVTIWFVEGVFYKWKNNLVLERSYDVDNTIQSSTIARQTAILDGVEEKRIASVDSVIDDVLQAYKNEHGQHTADEHSNANDAHGDGH